MTEQKRNAPIRKIVATALAVALYFLTAHFLTASYVDSAPKDKDAAQVIGPFRLVNGFYEAGVWIVAKDGPITIYENGISLGRAHNSYKDTTENFSSNGRQWERVEFYSASDPNANGRHYWAVK